MVYLFMVLAIFIALMFLASDSIVRFLGWAYDRVAEAVNKTRENQ